MYKKTIGWPINTITGECVNPDTNIEYLKWVNQGNTLEYSLEDAKLNKLASITTDRDTALQADVVVAGNTWQADSRSQELLIQAITMYGVTNILPSVWRTSDNINITITSINQLVDIAGAIATQVQTAYANSWSRKEALTSATTLQEVEAI